MKVCISLHVTRLINPLKLESHSASIQFTLNEVLAAGLTIPKDPEQGLIFLNPCSITDSDG